MKIFVSFIIVSLTIISCTKSVNNESQDIVNTTITESPMYKYDFYKVKLANGNIIYKQNSLNTDRNLVGIDNNENYDIIFVNTNDNTKTTIASDKFFKTKALPVVYNQTRQNRGGDDTIDTAWWKCFVLQILEKNNYKLIYIDDFNNDMKIKEYEYKNSYYPDIVTITVTPNYFMVRHDETEGEEYILINQHTGEYEIIDTQENEGH